MTGEADDKSDNYIGLSFYSLVNSMVITALNRAFKSGIKPKARQAVFVEYKDGNYVPLVSSQLHINADIETTLGMCKVGSGDGFLVADQKTATFLNTKYPDYMFIPVDSNQVQRVPAVIPYKDQYNTTIYVKKLITIPNYFDIPVSFTTRVADDVKKQVGRIDYFGNLTRTVINDVMLAYLFVVLQLTARVGKALNNRADLDALVFTLCTFGFISRPTDGARVAEELALLHTDKLDQFITLCNALLPGKSIIYQIPTYTSLEAYRKESFPRANVIVKQQPKKKNKNKNNNTGNKNKNTSTISRVEEVPIVFDKPIERNEPKQKQTQLPKNKNTQNNINTNVIPKTDKKIAKKWPKNRGKNKNKFLDEYEIYEEEDWYNGQNNGEKFTFRTVELPDKSP
jgi:hypothetical protein